MMRFYLFVGAMLALAARPALAQQPALPGAPQPALPGAPQPAPAPGPTGPELPFSTADLVLGSRYEVTLQSGTTFTGTLTTLSLDALEFETTDLGHLRVLRTELRQVRRLAAVAKTGLRPGYYDIGNGNRLFFAPTGRGLRKGEGALQVVNLFLVGANYGINDYLSIGGYFTLIPGIGVNNQFLLLTPKVSLPVSERLHVGLGVLYLRIPDFDGTFDRSYGAGIIYANGTYGSADNNVTLGVGYGFFDNSVGQTPVIEIGGQRRISRRVSLISENYLVTGSGIGGLYGARFNWKRASFGIGAYYAASFTARNDVFTTTYIVPIYYDFTFRFGKPYQKPGN